MGHFRRTVAALVSAALVAPASAMAQQPESAGSDRPRTAAADKQNPPADLPVSLDRIRRELVATTRTTSSNDPLRLEYYIDVYGRAPRIELFAPTENLAHAPVMYGGMTHQEFLQLVTPQEFRAPAADIPSAIAALVKWLSEKNQKSGSDTRR